METYANTEISDQEFGQFQGLIYQLAGINLPPSKKAMVCSRLAKRLRAHRLQSFGDYYHLLSLQHHTDEVKVLIDLLTTHETYFFREMAHFDFLREQVLPSWSRGRTLRVWSAASSTGEEAYSIAMLLAAQLGGAAWEVVGTDISGKVIATASEGVYPMERARGIPQHYLERFCLRGVGRQEGTFIINDALRARVRFTTANICDPHPELGAFDVVFLRNVLIYFNQETKRQVAWCIARQLQPGGHFMVGHAESINGMADGIQMVKPSIYRKRAAG